MIMGHNLYSRFYMKLIQILIFDSRMDHKMMHLRVFFGRYWLLKLRMNIITRFISLTIYMSRLEAFLAVEISFII